MKAQRQISKVSIHPKLISLIESWAVISSLVIIVLLAASCNKQKEEEELPDLSNTSFEQVMENGGTPEKVDRVEVELASEEKEELREDGSLWMCSIKTVSVEDGNADFPLFNPNASVVYPGSLLQGKTLKNASPSVIPVKRGGGRISIDIIDGSAQPAFTVEEVSKSSIANAANQIIGNSSGSIPANFNFTYDEIKSEEHLAFGLGLEVKSQFAEVAAKFSFTKDESYSHFLVKLNQSFYTLSFDIPTTYAELFAPEVTPADLAKYVGTGNPATFISDVTYGRIYYMLIESTSSSLDIKAKLQASFSSGVTSGSVDLDTEYLKSLNNLKINVVAFGGEAASTFETIGETNIGVLATLFGKSSDIKTGVPISYVVRDAINKEVVNVKLATEYDVKECKPIASALGNTILHFDAETLLETSPYYEYGSIENNGKFRYSVSLDAFVKDIRGIGVVVEKWKDLSENELHASSVVGDAASRPLFIEKGFNNGKPAVEFFSASSLNVVNRLTFSGGIFTNTNYTLFFVVSCRPMVNHAIFDLIAFKSNVIAKQPNYYGNFISGSNNEPNKQMKIGFEDGSFRLSHASTDLLISDGSIKPKADFQVIAIRFSQTEGTAVYVNGIPVGNDASMVHPLITNEGAMLSSGNPANSRIRFGEIRAYKTAASEKQIQQETAILNEKFGL